MTHVRSLVALAALAGCAAESGPTDDAGGPPPPDLACPAGQHAVDGGCDSTLTWMAMPAQSAIAPGRDHHATFIASGASAGPGLYVLGGTDHYASYILSDVQRAPIGPDGTPGAWQKLAPLPRRLAGHGIAQVDDIVIVVGGVSVSANGQTFLTDKVSTARVQPDGTLSAWVDQAPVPPVREHLSLVTSDHWVYAIGGLVGTDGTSDVSRAQVAADGTISSWTKMTPLPDKRSHQAAAVAAGAIWLTGGLEGDPASNAPALDDVLRAPINADGTLGSWTTVGTLPAPLCVHSELAVGNTIYVVGGIEGSVDFTANVRRASVAADGTIGAWEDAPMLPSARGHVLETPLWNQRIYSVGGSIFDLSVLGDVVVGTFQ
jgi:hypothetical protein